VDGVNRPDILLDVVDVGGFDILVAVRGGYSQRFRRLHSKFSEENAAVAGVLRGFESRVSGLPGVKPTRVLVLHSI
jgi:hypothetical protein